MQIAGFHAVTPKLDCPHCTPENLATIKQLEGKHVNDACANEECKHRGENWICLKPECRHVACSRYVKQHMLDHQKEHSDLSHPIAFSFADFSYWCYACDDYVEHPLLQQKNLFYPQKFAEGDSQKQILDKIKQSEYKEELNEADEDAEDSEEEQKKDDKAVEIAKPEQVEETKDEVAGLTKMMGSFSLDDEDKNFTYQQLVQGLKSGYFKRIFVMTGAGISVSCGIPDFRSPGTGLYDNLQQYDLPRPEAIFTLDYFLEKPQAFYEFAQNFDLTKFDPSPTHYFIKMLNDKGILALNATQNIDNLEEKTGIPMEKVVQAHGANRGASCGRCRAEADKDELQKCIRENKVMYCTEKFCEGKNSPIKPDITFFGEGLPEEFMDIMMKQDENKVVAKTDLLIVMGTALAVTPFNVLPSLIRGVPQVLFNMENTKDTGGIDFTEQNRRKLFVQGKCDETIAQLCADIGWSEDFRAVLPDVHKGKEVPAKL